MKSRRTLSSEQARAMVRVREARRAYVRIRHQCLWSSRADIPIGIADVEWVAERLIKHSERSAFAIGRALCR